jgi:hypothetical protein
MKDTKMAAIQHEMLSKRLNDQPVVAGALRTAFNVGLSSSIIQRSQLTVASNLPSSPSTLLRSTSEQRQPFDLLASPLISSSQSLPTPNNIAIEPLFDQSLTHSTESLGEESVAPPPLLPTRLGNLYLSSCPGKKGS